MVYETAKLLLELNTIDVISLMALANDYDDMESSHDCLFQGNQAVARMDLEYQHEHEHDTSITVDEYELPSAKNNERSTSQLDTQCPFQLRPGEHMRIIDQDDIAETDEQDYQFVDFISIALPED